VKSKVPLEWLKMIDTLSECKWSTLYVSVNSSYIVVFELSVVRSESKDTVIV
jgi:hypothetical protein